MQIAITGATGFVGHYIARHLAAQRYRLRCWYREGSDRGGFEQVQDRIEWLAGGLGDRSPTRQLVSGCDALVHAALYHPGGGFRGGEGDLIEFAERNIVGTLQLIEEARAAGVGRFIFISTCAVHDKILDDRRLDETHPTWSESHYGAHKAAIEAFVHSYGFGHGYDICALRPTGVYGVARPATDSKWFTLVQKIVRGQSVTCRGGGKEVHAADVARAVDILLKADGIAGEAYNCYDRYVSEYEVATIAKRLSGSTAEINGESTKPKHEIETYKLRGLGMTFGGTELLERTIWELVQAAK